MPRPSVRGAWLACAALSLLSAVPALAQRGGGRPTVVQPASVTPPGGGGGDATPPSITFSPAAGTFYAPYAPTFNVRVDYCDNASLNSNTRSVKLNNVAQTAGFSTGTKAGCAVYGFSNVTVTLQPGSNTLLANICDSSGNCTSKTDTYEYATADATAPTVSITPGTSTQASATVFPTVTFCDGNALTSTRSITFNGADVTSGFSYSSQTGTAGSSCASKFVSTRTGGALALVSGTNTLVVTVKDTAGNWGTQTVTWTYRPAIDTSPTNQFRTGPGMFDATLSYSTPAYRSLDGDHSVTLVYASSQARPNATMAVDVTDNSAQPADTMSFGLLWHGVWQIRPDGVQTDINYRTVAGTNRLSSFYGANGSPTRSMDMQAVVKRFWTGGSAADTVPLRILVINEKDSPYGAGWTVAGVERVVSSPANGGDPGIMVLHGDGTGTYYPMYTYCDPAKVCNYGHTPGEFGTMAYDSVNARYVRTARDGTKSTFDAAGQLLEVRDRLNNVQSYAWSGGHISTITDPAGKVTTFGYDAAGKLSTITDPAGRVTNFVVNAANDLVSITDPEGVVAMAVTYNTSHRVTSYVDRAQRTWTYTWDVFGKLATTVSPSFTAEAGQSFQQTVTYASTPMVVQGAVNAGTHTAPLPRVDPATLRVSVTDPMGRITRYALDPWETPSRVEDPVGYVSTMARNAEGQVISTVDAKGNTTSYTWSMGDMTRVSSPTTGTINLAYDGFGHLGSITGSTAETVAFYNINTGLMDSTIVAGADTSRYTYDSRGRVLTVTDPEHHVTSYDYTDPSGWMNTRSVTSGGRTTYYRYDTYGRLLGATDPDGRETTFQYDVLNRQRFVTTPDAGATEYVWGRLFLDRVNDPRGLAYIWTRNAMGWVTSESRPGDTTGVHLSTVFDRYGRPTAVTNRRGQSVSVVYDTQDRVVSRTADGQTTTFAFSPDQPTDPNAPSWVAVSNAESTDTVRVDGKGRVTSAVSIRTLAGVPAQRYELQPRYDALSRPVGLVVLQPMSVRDSIGYGYDPATFRLASMRDMAAGTTGFSYTHDGTPWRATLPNTQQITQGYTSLHQLNSIRYGAIAIDDVAGVEYEYDALDRIQSWIRPNYGRSREFTYSPNGRWLSGYADYQQNGNTHPTCTLDPDYGRVCSDPAAVMTYTGGDSFTYDLGGNPTNHGGTVGAGNRLATYDGYTLTYDVDGNLVSKTKTGFTQTFTWNSLNQLASVTTNGATVSYGYDGMGKRVRRQQLGTDTGYLYDDAGNLLLEYNGNGVQAKYTYYPGSDEPHSMSRGGQTYYYATDALGSVLALFNSGNTVVNQYTYLPFGEAQSTSETVANPLRFAGRELDATSGLYYNNARWYDPSLHRFVSEDPAGTSGGLNLYAYVANDPVNFVDPSGLFMGKPKKCSIASDAMGADNSVAVCLSNLMVIGGASEAFNMFMLFVQNIASHNSTQGPIAGEGGDGGGRGGSRNNNQCQGGAPSRRTHGVGLFSTVSGQGSFGKGHGVAGTVTAQGGIYWGSKAGWNGGTMLTAGAVAGGPTVAIEAPGGVTTGHAVVYGASKPAHTAGIYFTNATSTTGHQATFDNINLSVNWLAVTGSWDPSTGVWQLSIGFTRYGAGIGFSRYNTYTWNSHSIGCSGGSNLYGD